MTGDKLFGLMFTFVSWPLVYFIVLHTRVDATVAFLRFFKSFWGLGELLGVACGRLDYPLGATWRRRDARQESR